MNCNVLYDACIVPARSVVKWLRAVHGAHPRALRVDFAVTPSLAVAWRAQVEGGVATGAGLPTEGPVPKRWDVVAATNFSLGNLHTRAQLLTWMRQARAALRPGGLVAADLYGGTHAWLTGLNVRALELDDGTALEFTLEQRAADPVTGLVENALHFRWIPRGRKRAVHARDAFVFRWRLWSPAELSDAFRECGFSRVSFHLGLARRALTPADGLPDNWVLHVMARR